MHTDTSGARNTGERLLVIANPRAGAGSAGRNRAQIERAVDRAFARAEVVWTEGPGHASEVARERAGSADIVAALGGDGTCHEVVNGLFDGERARFPKTVFTSLPFGTGTDLARSLDLPRRLEDALWVAATGMTLPLDVGWVRTEAGGQRMFLNVAGIGANASVAGRVNAGEKRLGPMATYLAATLQTALAFRPVPVRCAWTGPDGDGATEIDLLAAFVANGHWCGAGIHVGRGGSMADGCLDVKLIPGMSVGRILRAVPRLYDGRMSEVEGVISVRASTLRVEGAVAFEADGEVGLGTGPATYGVLPRALQVRAAWRIPPRP